MSGGWRNRVVNQGRSHVKPAFEEIFRAARTHPVRRARSGAPGALTFHLSPGTPLRSASLESCQDPPSGT